MPTPTKPQDDRLEVRARRRRFALVYHDTLTTPGLSPIARLVYVLLATYADTDRAAYPTPTRMALELGCARSSVYEALTELEAAGIITRERRQNESGADRSTLITLNDEAPGSVREADTRSVREADTGVSGTRTPSVREADTRSVREADTNTYQENTWPALASERTGGLAMCARCHTLHELAESCSEAAERRRNSARAAASGMEAVRKAREEALRR